MVWGPNLIVPWEAYGAQVAIEFEGRLLPGPTDVHRVLTICYGSGYLVAPPVDKQVSHHNFSAFVAL